MLKQFKCVLCIIISLFNYNHYENQKNNFISRGEDKTLHSTEPDSEANP